MSKKVHIGLILITLALLVLSYFAGDHMLVAVIRRSPHGTLVIFQCFWFCGGRVSPWCGIHWLHSCLMGLGRAQHHRAPI